MKPDSRAPRSWRRNLDSLAASAADHHNPFVTAEARHLIEDFEKLPDAEKREVLSELLRAAQSFEYPPISDDEIASAANAVFLEYDRREAGE
jgi:hypothetical protein